MMKNKVLFIITILFLMFTTSACKKQETLILFNHEPITRKNVLKNDIYFQKGERIYYIFMYEKPMKDVITVELRSKSAKVKDWGVKVVYANDYKIYSEQKYFTDYVVLHSPGHYFMTIYSKGFPEKPLARNDFYVK